MEIVSKQTSLFIKSVCKEHVVRTGLTVNDLTIDKPLISMTFKIIVNDCRQNNNVILTSCIHTDNVNLEIFNCRNGERLRNCHTTVSACSSNLINTVSSNSIGSTILRSITCIPLISILTSRNNSSSQDSRIFSICSIEMLTKNCNNRCRSYNDGIRSGNRSGITTINNSHCSESISTSFVHGNGNCIQIFTRNCNTIQEPYELRSGISRSSSCNESELITLTNGVNCSIQFSHLSSNINNLGNIDIDRINHRTVTSISGHDILRIHMRSVNNSRSDGQSGNCRSCGPSVSDVFVIETIKICIQSDKLTIANIDLVSMQLDITT